MEQSKFIKGKYDVVAKVVEIVEEIDRLLIELKKLSDECDSVRKDVSRDPLPIMEKMKDTTEKICLLESRKSSLVKFFSVMKN